MVSFKKVTLNLENGKQLIINAPDNSDKNKYIKELKWNNTTYSKNYINHFDLLEGATLDFEMVATPDKERGISEASYPYSYSAQKK